MPKASVTQMVGVDTYKVYSLTEKYKQKKSRGIEYILFKKLYYFFLFILITTIYK